MSSLKILRTYLKEHEDFIKSEGHSIKQILKCVKDKLMDPTNVLRVLENKYAKYVKRQHQLMNVEKEFDNFDIDKVNDDLLKEVDETYDQIITQQLPEPTNKEMNETT